MTNLYVFFSYFTHIQEAYQPIVENNLGLTAVNYHPTSNISNLSDIVIQHFQLNGASVDLLTFENMKDMQISGAYKKIRPYLQQQLEKSKYDVLLHLHRDALKREETTISQNDISYARMSFVIGVEHANYQLNEAYAKAVSDEVNEIVPSISRGVITKTHFEGNGVYNQDLSVDHY